MAKVMVSLNFLHPFQFYLHALDILWLILCYSDMIWLKIILFLFWFSYFLLSIVHRTTRYFQVL